MADILTKTKRSELMSKVRSAGNASTEQRLVLLFRKWKVTGWRRGAVVRGPRKAVASRATKLSRFQVRPDFVFPKRTLAVFVDGCFWHGCPLHAVKPKQNAAFWRTKLAGNQARDRRVNRELRRLGWTVLRIWEHELTKTHQLRLLARLRRAHLVTADQKSENTHAS